MIHGRQQYRFLVHKRAAELGGSEAAYEQALDELLGTRHSETDSAMAVGDIAADEDADGNAHFPATDIPPCSWEHRMLQLRHDKKRGK